MDNLNEYLHNLISTRSYELHLEPNKPPYTVSSTGVNEISNSAILGTQISMMVFPLIPAKVKQELPDKPEVEFVLPHNLGNFNFIVKKSPAGFNVTIKPLMPEDSQPQATQTQPSQPQEQFILPQTEVIPPQNNLVSVNTSFPPVENQENSTQLNNIESFSPFTQPIPSPFTQEQTTSPFTQETYFTNPEVKENNLNTALPEAVEFESASLNAQIETQLKTQESYQLPDLIVEEPLNDFYSTTSTTSTTFIPQVETASVNDPEFITTFSDSSTYEEPGSKYDYGVEVISQPEYVDEYQPSQSYQSSEEVFQSPVETVSQFESIKQTQPMQELKQSESFASVQTSLVEQISSPVFEPVAVNSQAKKAMDDLFYKMAEEKASDLHMSVSVPPMIRKDGKMQFLQCQEDFLSPQRIKELLTSIMPAKNQEEFDRRHDTDFAYEIPELARFRANVFMDRKGMGGVFRIIPSKILTAEQLGLSKAIMDLCSLSKGLVVVTGPTGSGKSTTLCAMVDSINKTREDHIITIEDPIEFTHENQKCLVNQREVHNHTDSFKDALRAALREDPDILLVGEMRDLETISIAIETAETGHLVFGTLHTTTAASTIDRIIDQFPADRQQQIRVMLSESLKGVIAQTLLPKKGGGRVAALEVLIVTPAISNLIREGKTFQIPSAMQTGKNLGMVMLNDALFAHVQSGAVEPRDAYIKAVDKTNFETLLTRNGFKL